MARIAVGPIRARRIVVYSLWVPFLYGKDLASAGAAVVLTLGALSAIRFALTRIESEGEDIKIVNFFRTIRLPRGTVQCAGFADRRFAGARPLVLLVDGAIMEEVKSVSIWARQMRWPDQAFVRGERTIARLTQFFEVAQIPFDYQGPLKAPSIQDRPGLPADTPDGDDTASVRITTAPEEVSPSTD